MLYVFAFVYLGLAMYLYQVVPQTYGVPKKWNFLWAKDRKKKLVNQGDQMLGQLPDEAEDENTGPVIDFD